MRPSAPGWYPDPTGRHERRYWSGFRWTRHVADGHSRAEDPLEVERDTGAEDARQRSDPLERGGTRVSARASLAVPQHRRDPLRPSRSTPTGGFDDERDGDERPRRGARVVVGVAVTGLVVLAALGGAYALGLLGDDGGGDGTEAGSATEGSGDPLEEHIVGWLLDLSEGRLAEDKAHCAADAGIAAVTRERLMELGVMNQNDPMEVLAPDETVLVLKAMFDCFEDDDVVSLFAAAWNPALYGDIPDAAAPCMFRGWLAGWGRIRFAEIIGSSMNSDTGRPIGEVVTPEENTILVDTVANCLAELDATSTTTTAPA